MRTRFAPSPTGFLHVGGLRTALFSYLLAKKEGGTFFIRIEDTDRERHVEGAAEHLHETLLWAGLKPDDGPYFQSERLEIYREHAQRLIESGHAYRCFCTKDRLEEARKEQSERKQPPMYDRSCVSMNKEESEERSKTESHVVRLLVPRGGKVQSEDRVRGIVEFATNTLDDSVLLKSDGYPTYHLAHVVDDHLMGTTLVIRGEEWLPSLPKHLLLFKAFGWKPPEYAHVPLLLAKGGGKLSKRMGDVSVEAHVEKGYLREALINFIALLGWNPGTEKELFSLEELTKEFSLERVQKSGAIFDTEKLDWLQGQWVRKLSLREFANRIRPIIAKEHPAAADDADFERKAALVQERVTFFSESPTMLGFFYEEPAFDTTTAGRPKVSVDLLANEKQKVKREDLSRIFSILTEALESVEEWNEETIKAACFSAAEKNELKHGQLLWPMRAALTGLPYSPGAFEVASVLGKDIVLRRISNAKNLKSQISNHKS